MLACAEPRYVVPPVVPEPTPEPAPVPEPLAPSARPCERVDRIVVYKSERRLVAECEGGASRTFTAALGREPVGPKERAGDSRTPEGAYRIAGPARPSRFHLFIPIDYPALEDADRALVRGELDRATHTSLAVAIERAKRNGGLPPQESVLGGGLGFHGEGDRWRGDSEYLDWTNGCLAVTDDQIEFLAERAAIGTPVLVLP